MSFPLHPSCLESCYSSIRKNREMECFPSILKALDTNSVWCEPVSQVRTAPKNGTASPPRMHLCVQALVPNE